MIRHTFFVLRSDLGQKSHHCARCGHPTADFRAMQAHAALLRLPHVEVTP